MFEQQTNFLKVSKKINAIIIMLFILGLFLLVIAAVFSLKAVNDLSIKQDRLAFEKKQTIFRIKSAKQFKAKAKPAKKVIKPVAAKIAAQLKKTVVTPVVRPRQKTVQKAVVRPAVPAVSNCARVNYLLPGPIDLSNRPAGLTRIQDPINYFRVYGRDSRTIQQQIWRCGVSSAIGKSHIYAISQSRMNFSYQIKKNNNKCSLTNVKLGLRTKITMPTWTADTYTPQVTKNNMSRFLSGLLTHERGHGAIDVQYANRILADLNNLSTDCGSINNQARSIITNLQRQLANAQHAYEIRTNYGANQGGWL